MHLIIHVSYVALARPYRHLQHTQVTGNFISNTERMLPKAQRGVLMAVTKQCFLRKLPIHIEIAILGLVEILDKVKMRQKETINKTLFLSIDFRMDFSSCAWQ